MIKSVLAGLLVTFALSGLAAAVDANKATRAELESVNGIGPSIAERILDERRNGPFKDWQDMIDRVKGVSGSNAAKFSAEGLTVNGRSYRGATAAAKEDVKAKAADAQASAGRLAPE
ncbi:MAG TPA: helix-hairpin-helix domain-containing protein [Burkholderiaceae bacterium]|jgi:competence protein ComEA